ncbi:MAG: hypothetical protein M5R38_13490 [Candidatus Methylomirabilis sp.]|nr:hypothetical protein [Candidatus Methylomirabilis sp.]
MANLSAVTPAGLATATVSGNTVSFTSIAEGSYSFTYQARDTAGALSNTATVTVTVNPTVAETLSINRALYISNTRYRVEGQILPFLGQTIRLQVLSGATVVRTDTIIPRADGKWLIDRLGVALPAGPLTVRAISSNGTVATATLIRQ